MIGTVVVRWLRARLLWSSAATTVALSCLFLAPSGEGEAETRQYVYDAAGQLIAVVTDDGTAILYEFDAAGNRTSLRVARGAPDTVSAIIPDTVGGGTTTRCTITGDGLEGATAVVFEASGITATLAGRHTDNVLGVTIDVAADVPAGAYPFIVERSAAAPIPSGEVVLNVSGAPVIIGVQPATVLQGQTVDPWVLLGTRLGGATEVRFDRPGLTATNLQATPDGTLLTARLHADLAAPEGPVSVEVVAPGGVSNEVVLQVGRRGGGLLGFYWDQFSQLDEAGLPVVPVDSPTFGRSDPDIRFGTDTGFNWRPCFRGNVLCVSGPYTVTWNGFIYLAEDGLYTFGTNSSDASRLRIAGQDVAVNPGAHPPQLATGTFTVSEPGSFPLELAFNSSDSFGGIDLLYGLPGAGALSLVPAAILWNDGMPPPGLPQIAEAAVSFFNPELPIPPEGTDARAARDAVSFFNPEIPPPPEGTDSRAAHDAVSFFNPETPPPPDGTDSRAAHDAVSFFNPETPPPAVENDDRTAHRAVSFFNPETPAPPEGTDARAAHDAVSFFNPAAPTPPPEPSGRLAHHSVSLVSGPAARDVSPAQVSRGAPMPVTVTVHGAGLAGATGVVVCPPDDIALASTSASADGTVVTVEVTLTPSTPLGFRALQVEGPGWLTLKTAGTGFEVVP